MATPNPADFIFSTLDQGFNKALDSYCFGILPYQRAVNSPLGFPEGCNQKFWFLPVEDGIYSSPAANTTTAYEPTDLVFSSPLSISDNIGANYLLNPVVGNTANNTGWSTYAYGHARMPSTYTLQVYEDDSRSNLLFEKTIDNAIPGKDFYEIATFRELVNAGVFNYSDWQTYSTGIHYKIISGFKYFVIQTKGAYPWVTGVYPNNWDMKAAYLGTFLSFTGVEGSYVFSPFYFQAADPVYFTSYVPYNCLYRQNNTVDTLNTSIKMPYDYNEYFKALNLVMNNEWEPPVSNVDRMIKSAVDSIVEQSQPILNLLQGKCISISPSLEAFIEENSTVELKFLDVDLLNLVIRDITSDSIIFQNGEFQTGYTGESNVIGNLTTITINAIPAWAGAHARLDVSTIP